MIPCYYRKPTMANNDPLAPALELGRRPNAGDVAGFPGGRVSYLAPLPLPTGLPAQDYAHAVGEVNDTYMEFGTGLPNAFAWQYSLGLPFSFWLFFVFLAPLIVLFGTPILGGTQEVAKEMAVGFFVFSLPFTSILALGA